MVDFCLQIQPNRIPGLDLAAVRRACEAIAESPFVARYQEHFGEDGGPYVNFLYATGSPSLLWLALRE